MKNFVKLLVSNTELYKLFKNNFTYHSSNLEGSTVTLEDNNKIINEELNHNQIMKITKEKYDDDEVQENYNNGELFDYVIKTLNEPLTIKELYVWHNLIKKDTIWAHRYTNSYGKFKSIPNKVGGNETQQPHEVYDKIQSLLDEFKNKKMNLDDISLFQCKFQTIHPFLDGNGRIGRMIMLKQCLINNIALFVITSDDKNEFINCLNLYRKTNSELFLSKFLTQLQKIFLFKYSNFLTSSQDIRWIEILKLLEKNTYINRKNIETLFNIKEGQAKKILSKLIKENKIRKIGNTNGSVYTLL